MFDVQKPLVASAVQAFARGLASPDRGLDDASRIDLIRELETLKCAAEAAQAVLSAAFDASQRAAQASQGVPAARQGRGVAAQIALARRESPHRGQQHLGLAKVLTTELPHTMAAFRAGRVTEWRATLVARETACLSREDRMTVDAEIAGNAQRFEAMGDGELVSEARTIAYRLDPESVVRRRSRAENDRRVSLRPAPDVMSQLSALLPVKDGVAVYAVLSREADRLRAAGDHRGRGQIMADTLVRRVLSTAPATDTRPAVMINLVVSDRVLLGGGDDPAYVEGYGPIPADLARQLAGTTRAWVRRLYATPETGRLVAMDSTSRLMPAQLARMIRLRDQRCRTRWCDAPVRHSDHVTAVAEGGPTNEPNGQGLCEACNHAKQASGWRARPSPGARHAVETTTPTGHTYTSMAPALVRTRFIESGPGLWTLVA
ncbi:HNH endonuclease [Nocardioides conyzicola]|uniref:HNH endonuclease signature motif containing protein n=1 Tax=Nocardioides conyzicola TaxID=1651781 RepID=A0ABP8Y3T0_9ACTN